MSVEEPGGADLAAAPDPGADEVPFSAEPGAPAGTAMPVNVEATTGDAGNGAAVATALVKTQGPAPGDVATPAAAPAASGPDHQALAVTPAAVPPLQAQAVGEEGAGPPTTTPPATQATRAATPAAARSSVKQAAPASARPAPPRKPLPASLASPTSPLGPQGKAARAASGLHGPGATPPGPQQPLAGEGTELQRLRSAQSHLDSAAHRFFQCIDTALKTAREMQAVLDQVAAAAPSPKALSAANGLAKSVNRCAKGTARLFGAGADGPLDQLHDASLGLALLSRGLVNGWRVETGAPSLPKDEALARRQTMQHTMQQRVQTATPGSGQARGKAVAADIPAAQAGTSGAPPRTEEAASAPHPGPASTGDPTRDEAVAVLAHALAPRRAPLDVAAGLEQQLWLDRKEADGAVGDAYLCALRTLWDVLSPQSEACRPLLTQALLQGSLAPSDLVRGTPEQLQDAEHRTVRALGSESQSLAGEGAPPLPPGHGGPAGEHACATLPSVTAMDCDD
ncbi:hypothetical protein ACKKBG_A26630 [Auxenochlorella protothecoides x Auxenochlorella symbiontica]